MRVNTVAQWRQSKPLCYEEKKHAVPNMPIKYKGILCFFFFFYKIGTAEWTETHFATFRSPCSLPVDNTDSLFMFIHSTLCSLALMIASDSDISAFIFDNHMYTVFSYLQSFRLCGLFWVSRSGIFRRAYLSEQVKRLCPPSANRQSRDRA